MLIDAQLSPNLADWVNVTLRIEAISVKKLNLVNTEDQKIFDTARKMNAVIMTKDEDFVQLLHRLGSPPKILWITCGNTSNQRMKEILLIRLSEALEILKSVDLVEISD